MLHLDNKSCIRILLYYFFYQTLTIKKQTNRFTFRLAFKALSSAPGIDLFRSSLDLGEVYLEKCRGQQARGPGWRCDKLWRVGDDYLRAVNMVLVNALCNSFMADSIEDDACCS